jgi:flavin reductase (DIM6/NTAB) family NADH-FMN oxidoreductase RutF
MTANAFTSVSLDPPLVLVCVEKVTRFHQAVVEGDAVGSGWAVSILGVSAHQAAVRFARRGRPLANQMSGFGGTRGAHTNAMILDGALGALECRTYAVHDGGDHSIVIGEVLTVIGPRPDGTPLLYFRGDYRELAAGESDD